MKSFPILHYGFEQPTPGQMGEWCKWFESIAARRVEMGHLSGGREISQSGIADLPLAKDSITGCAVIRAEDLDQAVEIAGKCPIVASTRVYAIMNG